MSNPLEMIMAFKSVHVLNDVYQAEGAKKPTLIPSHYCCVLVQGRSPVWGVWTIRGKFVRFAASREQIELSYPTKAWKRVMASWALSNADNDLKNVAKRVKLLEERYHTDIERNDE